MSGFDASRFLAPELPLSGGAVASEPNPAATVASVAGCIRLEDGSLVDEKTGEIIDMWASTAPTVAGVATVADLPLTIPFARELTAMFSYPIPPWLRPNQWRRLCEGARKFAETKAADALAKGWEPIELFGVYRHPWKPSLAVDGVVRLAAGRGIGLVEPHAIEILNKAGAHSRAYRAHFMTQRGNSLLMWIAFHPDNRREYDASGGV